MKIKKKQKFKKVEKLLVEKIKIINYNWVTRSLDR